jgi:hypothetical protein
MTPRVDITLLLKDLYYRLMKANNDASEGKAEASPNANDRARIVEMTRIGCYDPDYQKLSPEEKKARRLELKNESQRRIRAAKKAEERAMVGRREA